MILVASIIFLTLTVIIVLFQIALILGAPLGEYAMGGKYKGELPTPIKIAEVFQVFLLLFNLSVILQLSDWFVLYSSAFVNVYQWFILGLYSLSAIMNWISPSKKERYLWGPIALLILLATFVIILS